MGLTENTWRRIIGRMDLVTVPEAAKILGITERALGKRHHARGVGFRVGRLIVFTPADMDLMRAWPYRPGRPGICLPEETV